MNMYASMANLGGLAFSLMNCDRNVGKGILASQAGLTTGQRSFIPMAFLELSSCSCENTRLEIPAEAGHKDDIMIFGRGRRFYFSVGFVALGVIYFLFAFWFFRVDSVFEMKQWVSVGCKIDNAGSHCVSEESGEMQIN